MPHDACADVVLSDVFSSVMAGCVSFGYYEKCAGVAPRFRRFLLDKVKSMPREIVKYCRLRKNSAVYLREWRFDEPTGQSANIGKVQRMRQQPQTLMRYAVQSLHIKFGEWLFAFCKSLP